jgi:hypothetical protein
MLLLVLASVLATVAVANVFTYYPVSMSISAIEPPVIFWEGTNANKPDLGAANTITVTLADQNTTASITVHPTYQKTVYKDVLRINNTDTSKSYFVYIKINDPANSAIFTTANLVVKSGTTVVATIDLKSTGTVSVGELTSGSSWEVWLEFQVPGTVTLPATDTVSFELVYTPTSETPP